MTVYFRADRQRWMYDFTVRGKSHKEYARNEDGTKCETRRDAEAAECRARVAAALASKTEATRPRGSDYTLAMALDALKPKWSRQADWKNKRRAIAELIDYFYNVKGIKHIADIGDIEVQEYVDWSLARPVQLWKGGVRDASNEANARFWKTREAARDPHTVNDLYLNVLRQALKHAAKLRDPATKAFVFRDLPKVQRLKTERRDADPIPDAIVDEIFPSFPQHLQEAILLTAFFGFRRTEAFNSSTGRFSERRYPDEGARREREARCVSGRIGQGNGFPSSPCRASPRARRRESDNVAGSRQDAEISPDHNRLSHLATANARNRQSKVWPHLALARHARRIDYLRRGKTGSGGRSDGRSARLIRHHATLYRGRRQRPAGSRRGHRREANRQRRATSTWGEIGCKFPPKLPPDQNCLLEKGG
jgi:hypothetical protein